MPPSKTVLGDDLLPINPVAVVSYLQAKGPKIAQAVACMVNAFNYLAKAQCQGGWTELSSPKELTRAQKLTVDKLCRAYVMWKQQEFSVKALKRPLRRNW